MRGALALASVFALGLNTAGADDVRPLQELLVEGAKALGGTESARARPLFEEALARAQDEQRPVEHSAALRGLAGVLTKEGDYETALARLREALAIAQASGNRVEVGRVLNGLGSVTWYRDPAAARPFYEQALAEFEAAGDLEGATNTIGNIVLTLVEGEEEGWIERGLALAMRSGNAFQRGRFLQQRGDLKRSRGDFAGAREALLEAQRLFEQAGRTDAQATVLNSLGYLHRLHGRPDQALEFQKQSLELARQRDEPFAKVRGLTGIALALRDLRRYSEALATIEEGLALATAAGQPADMVVNLREMQAAVELDRGRPERAVELLSRIPLDDSATYAAGRRSLMAEALRRAGRPAEGLVQAEKAIELARSKLVEGMPAELAERAYCLDALGRPLEALADGRAALDEIERLREKLVADDFMRQGYGERVQEIYVFVVGLLQRLGRAEEALETANKARARAFLDRLGTRGAVAAGRRVAPATAADVRAAARRLDSTVLVYFVGPDDAYVWAVKADGPVVSAKVPASASRLASLVEGAGSGVAGTAVRGRAIEMPTRAGGLLVLGDAEQRWRQLYDLLLRPVRRSLPTSGARLTVVADGPLLRLPFAALRDGSGRYLVERYSIHYAPAVASLALAPTSAANANGGPRPVLLVGDPETYPDPGDGTSLAALPGSRRELDGIARLLAPGRVERLSGAAATEARLRERARGMDVVHFSTHGVVRDDVPLESFVALSPGAGGQADDGRLTSADVYGLSLDADLVFLSACRTGRGGVSADGVTGLTRAFFHAGAASIVATLSDVVDEPAHRLVSDFYREREAGAGKADALRRAQLAMLRALRAGQVSVDTPAGAVTLPESPALWAPFVLLGEP